MILPIVCKQGGDVRQFLRRRTVGPDETYNRIERFPLSQENSWGTFYYIVLSGTTRLPILPKALLPYKILWSLSPLFIFYHYRQSRNFIAPIYGGCQYFIQIWPMREQIKQKVKHPCFTLWCAIYFENRILMHLLLKIEKGVYQFIIN